MADGETGPRFVTNCTDPDGIPAFIETGRLADGNIQLSIGPGSSGVLTPKLAAQLRRQIAEVIADALQGARWEELSPGGFSSSGPGLRRLREEGEST
jgi:hypothetical protein